jgi:hypothetical protein
MAVQLNKQYVIVNWNKSEHWPRVDPNDPKSNFGADSGSIPEHIPMVVIYYLYDIPHRVKCTGSMCYDIKNGKDPHPLPEPDVVNLLEDDKEKDAKPKAKQGAKTKVPRQPRKPWKELTKTEQQCRTMNNKQKYDCEMMKVLEAYYLHNNKHLLFEECRQKDPYIYLHHFNDHSLCNRKWWCKAKRCTEDNTDLWADYCVNNKFRDKEVHAKLFEKVKAGMDIYFSREALAMVLPSILHPEK